MKQERGMIEAIKKSIEHWKDIRDAFDSGTLTNEGTGEYIFHCVLRFESRDGATFYRKCSNKECALCDYNDELSIENDVDECYYCPLQKVGNKCSNRGSTWEEFRISPTKDNAEKMIQVLEALLDTEDQ